MARPVAFDVETARERAMLVFWRKGYQATSLPNLLAAMGISRSSLYAAFGDKRALFVSCLDTFAVHTQRAIARACDKHAPLDALQAFLERNVTGPGRDKAGLGCMLVNTVLEMAGVDDELRDRASAHLADVESTFRALLRETGCTPAQAAEFAALLMLLNKGLRVAGRGGQPAQAQLDGIATAFRMVRGQLGLRPASRPA